MPHKEQNPFTHASVVLNARDGTVLPILHTKPGKRNDWLPYLIIRSKMMLELLRTFYLVPQGVSATWLGSQPWSMSLGSEYRSYVVQEAYQEDTHGLHDFNPTQNPGCPKPLHGVSMTRAFEVFPESGKECSWKLTGRQGYRLFYSGPKVIFGRAPASPITIYHEKVSILAGYLVNLEGTACKRAESLGLQ